MKVTPISMNSTLKKIDTGVSGGYRYSRETVSPERQTTALVYTKSTWPMSAVQPLTGSGTIKCIVT